MLAVGAVGLLSACSKDLSITNLNDPDTKRAFSTPADVQSLMKTSLRDWFVANQDVNPNLAFVVMADALTCSYGNFGMRFNSNEPRIAYANATTSGDVSVAEAPWENNYQALGEANDALNAIKAGLDLGNEGYAALGMFVQGGTLGNIALIYDQGFVIDETTPVPAPPDFVPYQQVADAAVAKFDAVIAATNGATWDALPEDVLPGQDVTPAYLNALANTMAARILAYTPRTAAENDAVDWARVASYASKGISAGPDPFDFGVDGDGGNVWDAEYATYANYDAWLRVDMRVIHELIPSEPDRFPSCNYVTPEANTLPSASADHRLETDFIYIDEIPYSVVRGCYHFSNWAHSRYWYQSWSSDNPITGFLPAILAAENDLLWAEGLARSGGDLTLASALVNNTRVGRGELPPVAADKDAILAAIQYEQDIELMASGGGIQFYDRRRIDGLQPGTPLHLPVPASELEINGLPVYTFGGAPPNPVFPTK